MADRGAAAAAGARSRLAKLAHALVDAATEYASTEALGLRVLASAVNLLQRTALLDRAAGDSATAGPESRRLLGPLVQFNGVAAAAARGHRDERGRAAANMVVVVEALREAQGGVAGAARAICDEVARVGAAVAGEGADALAARSVESPASVADYAAAATAVRAAVALDMLAKIAAAGAAGAQLTGVSRDRGGGGVLEGASAALAAVLVSWPSPLTRHLLGDGESDGASGGVRGAGRSACRDGGDDPGGVAAALAQRDLAWRLAAERAWAVTSRTIAPPPAEEDGS